MSTYPNGLRFRSIVSAWREDKDGDWIAGYHVERVVCVEVDVAPLETQSRRASAAARALMQLLYPQCNGFDVYNTVSEIDSPAEALGYVTGWADGAQRYEAHPIVAFRQQHDPAVYREPGALTWEQGRAHHAGKHSS